jgi:type II secretory pathway pseudopilin PulG
MKSVATKMNSRAGRAGAFSLVEVMVAVGLLAFIIVGLLAMFYQTQRAFRSSATQTDVLEAGRATMQLIRQDLQDMHVAGHLLVTNFLIQPSPVRPVIFPLPPNKSAADTLNADLLSLNFIQKANDFWAGVGYRIVGANGVGSLMRMEERKEGNLALDSFDPFTDNPATGPSQEGLINASYRWNIMPPDDVALHRVIDGVVHFSFIPYDTNGVAFPVAYAFTTNIPAYVDVELGILEPKTLIEFNNRNSINPGSAKAYLQDRVERVHLFKQRILIRTRS